MFLVGATIITQGASGYGSRGAEIGVAMLELSRPSYLLMVFCKNGASWKSART